jgi:hypothetical protein
MALDAPTRFLELARTTFQTDKELPDLRRSLETAFQSMGVSTVSLGSCGYTCTGTRYNEAMFDVTIYNAELPEYKYQVEVIRMRGCRHSFGVMADELAELLGVTYPGGKAVGIPMRPPPLPADFPPPKGFEARLSVPDASS